MATPAKRTNLSPLERGLSLSIGALAASEALRRRKAPRLLLGIAGSLLIYRGITGRSRLYQALGSAGSEVGTTVSACSQVTVQLSPAQVYRHLRDLTNLHLFSRFVESADKLDEQRWRVRLRAPLDGERVLVIRRKADEEGRRLAWASAEGSTFPAALELRFREGRTGTEIHADAWLVPPAPAVVPSMLRRAERSRLLRRAGIGPSQLLEQELRRLRQLLETGETATVEGQSAGGRRARKAASAGKQARKLEAGAIR